MAGLRVVLGMVGAALVLAAADRAAAAHWEGEAAPEPPRAYADDTKEPAKKDSIAELKPRSAKVTGSVEPAEAKPGDTVTFSVAFKLDPGFHIYKYDKNQGTGRINTNFDFFDTADLKTEGDWTPSRAPEKDKDPNAPDGEFVEYYENDVTFSIRLRVPDGAEPGKRSLRCQARYQVCDAKMCLFPGQWTLPAVELTIIGGGKSAHRQGEPARGGSEPGKPPVARAVAAKVVETSLVSPVAQGDAADSKKPAKKDAPKAIKPKSVELTPAVEPAEAKPGDTVNFRVNVTLNPGFHIYKFDKKQGPGPINTTFDFFDTADLKIEGDWTASRAAEKHKDPNFGDLEFVEYYENDVTFNIRLRVPDGTQPGKRTLRCQARYQVCDAKVCSIPGQWTLPAVELTVVDGGGAAAASREGDAPAEPRITTQKSASAPSSAADGVTSTAAPRSAAAQPLSEIAQKAQQGIIPFLLASALGGLFALVMPCVWPMVPITVNFFVKQGQGKEQGGRGKTTGLAIAYCLSIIAIFTIVGVAFSFFFSAAALQRLANNPWLNLAVAALFIAFGLSLLGLFEISLPSFLLNASSKRETQGGLIGVFFMALTLTITSFTCTFPVVGGLLVMAAGGNFFYPIIGLGTFATVIALPFFLLALSPSLISKMPRSGDWMNAVKVVGGLVEIGAALKFVNTAELAYVTPENAWFDAQVVLTAWVVLAVVCGMYLLGLFRTDHDHDEVKVGPGRMICGALFLGLALFMAPALFGRVPQSAIWSRLIAGLLPPDANELGAWPFVGGPPGSEPALAEVKASSTDPELAERQEKRVHGVQWGMSLDQALDAAKARQKPVLIDFTGVNCANCRAMEIGVFPLPAVVAMLQKFVTVQLYTDFVPIGSLNPDQREKLAERNQDRIIKMTNGAINPSYVVLSPNGEVLATNGGFVEAPVFVEFLSKALAKGQEAITVARNDPNSAPPNNPASLNGARRSGSD
jgi:thiol:disulfide interchange protein